MSEPPRPPSGPPPEYRAPTGATDVTDAQAATEAVTTLSSCSELAVDVEADSMHAFRAKLCFVQVASNERIFLFDTLVDDVRAEALAPLFADPGRTKYFHAAGGDLAFLADVGVRVQGLFDTHRAATLLGWQKVGLADLVQDRLQIQLLKAHQQSDFSLRPLPPGMRDYIADDVRYLCEIGRWVREACQQADILEEVLLDCQRLSDEAAKRPEVGSDYRPKISKGKLGAEKTVLALAIISELHARRLAWAEEADVPMGRMLSNAALEALASKPPTSLKELRRVEGVRGPFIREHGDEVLAILAKLSEKSTKGELPPLPAENGAGGDPKRKKRGEQLKAWRTEKANARKVTPSVVLPNALLDELAKEPPENVEALSRFPYFGEKRRALYGAELVALLKG